MGRPGYSTRASPQYVNAARRRYSPNLTIRAYALNIGAHAPICKPVALKPAACNCLALRQAARVATSLYDQHLAPSGLRTTQFSVLAKLKHLGPMSINALAAELLVDRSTLGRNILPLERDGLIRIEPNASDARSKELHLTRKGAARVGAALERWAEAQKRFEAAYGKERSTQLRSLLHELVTSELGATPLTDE
jgi:DNA-binding MarR family transcriptional regulator